MRRYRVLSGLQNPNRWTDQAFTLRPAQVFPCLPTDAYALTLIDPMLPLFARPPLDGLFASWLTADRKPATSLPAYQSAALHHKWPASFRIQWNPLLLPFATRVHFHSPGSKIGLSSSCGEAFTHSAKASVCALQSGAPKSCRVDDDSGHAVKNGIGTGL